MKRYLAIWLALVYFCLGIVAGIHLTLHIQDDTLRVAGQHVMEAERIGDHVFMIVSPEHPQVSGTTTGRILYEENVIYLENASKPELRQTCKHEMFHANNPDAREKEVYVKAPHTSPVECQELLERLG